MQEIFREFQDKRGSICSSVVSVTEVLPKPVSMKREEMAQKFIDFLSMKESIYLAEISFDIAEKAGRLRGKYTSLKTLDALQIAAASYMEIDAFVTNDLRLKQVDEIRMIVLKDFIS